MWQKLERLKGKIFEQQILLVYSTLFRVFNKVFHLSISICLGIHLSTSTSSLLWTPKKATNRKTTHCTLTSFLQITNFGNTPRARENPILNQNAFQRRQEKHKKTTITCQSQLNFATSLHTDQQACLQPQATNRILWRHQNKCNSPVINSLSSPE